MRADVADIVNRWDKKTAKKAKDFGGQLEALGNILGDERAVAVAPAVSKDPETYSGATWGVLCVSEQRLLFLGRNGQSQMDLDEVTEVRIYPGRLTGGGVVEVQTGPSETFFELETQSSTGPLWTALQEQWAKAKETAKQRKAAGGSGRQASTSMADELSKLADLRAQGILTDEEFATQKARLLSS